jgi:hypothetical protein
LGSDENFIPEGANLTFKIECPYCRKIHPHAVRDKNNLIPKNLNKDLNFIIKNAFRLYNVPSNLR